MKKLQNNFTTHEQSRRLLQLGVPADSADCIYVRLSKNAEFNRKFREDIVGENPYEHLDFYYPCWSVGRLLEISELCYTSLYEHDYFIRQKDCNTDFLIKMFELGADRMDFLKLEVYGTRN
ncbi:MAG: hypothetical protein IJS13_04895 [Paludibacteraceae bacterium]|nr:hypothetical protein [Paludibacteraceae bacterium]